MNEASREGKRRCLHLWTTGGRPVERIV